jgi:hypothetical protein
MIGGTAGARLSENRGGGRRTKFQTNMADEGSGPNPSSPVPRSWRVNKGAAPRISDRADEVRACSESGVERAKRDRLPDGEDDDPLTIEYCWLPEFAWVRSKGPPAAPSLARENAKRSDAGGTAGTCQLRSTEQERAYDKSHIVTRRRAWPVSSRHLHISTACATQETSRLMKQGDCFFRQDLYKRYSDLDARREIVDVEEPPGRVATIAILELALVAARGRQNHGRKQNVLATHWLA